ncbi:MAG: GYD domain-containing protein [Anaerolineales bacterium]|nr:GYD domain-containing protein [Anaerolineales bacterium]
MSKYLFQVNYVGEGVKGLLKDGGTKRRTVVEGLIKSMGGSVETFYYAFGDTDLYLICELPDHATATALALTVTSTGTVTLKTTVLLTPEEVDAAAKLTPAYTAPGK